MVCTYGHHYSQDSGKNNNYTKGTEWIKTKASDERMMDAKYRNRKFKLSALMRCFLVINHLWSHSSKLCKNIYKVFI